MTLGSSGGVIDIGAGASAAYEYVGSEVEIKATEIIASNETLIPRIMKQIIKGERLKTQWFQVNFERVRLMA